MNSKMAIMYSKFFREKNIDKEMFCEPCFSVDLEIQATHFFKNVWWPRVIVFNMSLSSFQANAYQESQVVGWYARISKKEVF